jgi:uncharacterized protein (TIGR00730 family)
MRRLCVFCGSNPGHDPAYRALAEEVGSVLARQGIGLVYGGGRIGLMGSLADAALAARGEVIGVIPQSLMDREIGHTGLTELRVVGSMHERKALMADLVDGFVALPGGIGTLEELLLTFLDRLVVTGFVKPEHRAMLLEAASPEELLACFRAYEPPAIPKWITSAET